MGTEGREPHAFAFRGQEAWARPRSLARCGGAARGPTEGGMMRIRTIGCSCTREGNRQLLGHSLLHFKSGDILKSAPRAKGKISRVSKQRAGSDQFPQGWQREKEDDPLATTRNANPRGSRGAGGGRKSGQDRANKQGRPPHTHKHSTL